MNKRTIKRTRAISQLLSIPELLDTLNGKEPVVVLDVRPIAAYNGWPLNGEPCGGHVTGAKPFPLGWFDELKNNDIVAALQDCGVMYGTNVIVYGTGRDDAESAAALLKSLRFMNVRIFPDGFSAWADDPGRPISALPRFTQLVHECWLAQLLQGGDPPHYDGRPYVLAHTSFDNREDYDTGHIPGAISLDTLFLEEPEHWNCRNPQELEHALLARGITCDTMVVLYGRSNNPTMEMEAPGRFAGQLAAMRAALLLLYAGVEDVRVLDGGLTAWLSAEHSLSTRETTPSPADHFGRSIPARPECIIDIEQAKEFIADPRSELVSMRSWNEFIGKVSGYHYIGPRGRIPGAIFGNCGSDAYHMENYRNHDNTMRCYHDIEARWRETGVTPDKRIAFYCGTGWRASESFFYAYLMGWDRIAIYDGGWYEWSMDAGNPTETGIPGNYLDSGAGPDPAIDFAKAVAGGLSEDVKAIPCRFLYDNRGSALFEEICRQPEYYLTKTEKSILLNCASEIAGITGPVPIAEFGSGSAVKTRHLLKAYRHYGNECHYIPIDINADAIESASQSLKQDMPDIMVTGIVGTYEHAFPLFNRFSPMMALFLGSTIGNFGEVEMPLFLKRLADHLAENDFFLLGADLHKHTSILEAAYNDAAGVTISFTRNLFERMNRELNSGIDLDAIMHEAHYNIKKRRIEIYARFTKRQEITLGPIGTAVTIEAGERIQIEISRKFLVEELRELLERCGFRIRRVYTDEKKWFALILAERKC